MNNASNDGSISSSESGKVPNLSFSRTNRDRGQWLFSGESSSRKKLCQTFRIFSIFFSFFSTIKSILFDLISLFDLSHAHSRRLVQFYSMREKEREFVARRGKIAIRSTEIESVEQSERSVFRRNKWIHTYTPVFLISRGTRMIRRFFIFVSRVTKKIEIKNGENVCRLISF